MVLKINNYPIFTRVYKYKYTFHCIYTNKIRNTISEHLLSTSKNIEIIASNPSIPC